MCSVKIGIIGTGAIARTHAGILQQNNAVKLGSVYDVQNDSGERFAADFGMQALSSIEEVISDSDAVYVTVPNKFHAEITLKVLNQGKHVFCEKPFALNLTDAQKLVNAAEKEGIVYQLGFSRRLAPVYKKMKEMIKNGELTPKSFNIKMNRGELKVPPWTSDSKITGGFLFESTLHLIDMVRYLFGEVKEVTAVGSKSVYPCVDDFSMIFEMKNGIHGVLSSSAHTTWIFPFERVEIYGDHASIVNDEMETVTYCMDLNTPVKKLSYSTLPTDERWGFTQEDNIFVDRLLDRDSGENALVATYLDGYKNVELMEDIYEKVGLGL